jgi:hypothetical protein
MTANEIMAEAVCRFVRERCGLRDGVRLQADVHADKPLITLRFAADGDPRPSYVTIETGRELARESLEGLLRPRRFGLFFHPAQRSTLGAAAAEG